MIPIFSQSHYRRCASTQPSCRGSRSSGMFVLALLWLLLLFVCGLHRCPDTNSQRGIYLVRAEDEVEEGEYETDEADDDDEEEEESEAIIDAMTGESVIPRDDDGAYKTSLLPHNDHNKYSMEDRDPNLRPMTYDVGDGEQTTYVYVEPTIEEMYRFSSASSSDNDTQPQRVQRVTPQFNGFAGKFINMSNKKCTLYWEEYAGGPKHPMKNHNPFSASGTATFPTHRFLFTPADDPDTVLHTMIVKNYPDNLYFYDPYYVENDPIATEQNLQSNLTTAEREMYDSWLKTKKFNEYYLNTTGRSYLANYLRPPPQHYMWRGDYFGQTHSIITQETHFMTEPPKDLLQPITVQGKKRRFTKDAPRILSEYRDSEPLNLTLRVISVVPRTFQIDNFLSPVEVDHITELASGIKLSLSGTGEHEPGEKAVNAEETVSSVKKTRTSYNSWVKRERSPIIDAIYRRAADLLKIDEALLRQREKGEVPERDDHLQTLAEDLQLVNYKETQEYTSHHDFGYSRIGKEMQGARFATLLLYLNEGMVGGETSFPRYVNAESFRELKVTPEAGKAVLFYSQLPDGNLDDFSQHAAQPVIDGEKWVLDKSLGVGPGLLIKYTPSAH